VAAKIERREVAALKVRQWIKAWDKVAFSDREHRKKPDPYFYLFSLPAVELRNLCGIARRQASDLTPRAADLGIQREHDPERSDEIWRFVEYGYPWSTLSETKRKTAEFNDLRKPGWLPTAIVINILKPSDRRGQRTVADEDIISVREEGLSCRLSLPYKQWSKEWRPSEVAPLEVIDGQHRLWAFEKEVDTSFELPVVAFHGLDLSWQAYLFWTINIKPKRINPSLAFDLYPLLRSEDWLDKAEGHFVYRETRSQELIEALWSHSESPWYDRINMLGERKNRWVSQSAWIRTLMTTLVRSWSGSRSNPGGLFGARVIEGEEVLGWNRAQQAAFLISAWQKLHDAVRDTNANWAKRLRLENQPLKDEEQNSAFYSPHSLIVTDQGVRGFLHVLNDICFMMAPRLSLRTWRVEGRAAATDTSAVTLALKTLAKHELSDFVRAIAEGLATFDWRTSSARDLTDDERSRKLVFRGSSGYKEMRRQLLEHLKELPNDVGRTASRLLTLVT